MLNMISSFLAFTKARFIAQDVLYPEACSMCTWEKGEPEACSMCTWEKGEIHCFGVKYTVDINLV